MDRRSAVAGLGLLAASGRALAAKMPESAPPRPRLFTAGPLARNLLANDFYEPEPGLTWPDARLETESGKTIRLTALRGKLLLVVLWAEWCPYCQIELPALSYHCAKSNNDRFEIVPILTGSNNFNRFKDVRAFLDKIGAKAFPTLIDGSSDGDRLVQTVGLNPRKPTEKTGALPTALIIDRDGIIRGKSQGSSQVTLADGKDWTLWATNVGQQFVQTLAKGDWPIV
jgi:peroxiredoxin